MGCAPGTATALTHQAIASLRRSNALGEQAHHEEAEHGRRCGGRGSHEGGTGPEHGPGRRRHRTPGPTPPAPAPCRGVRASVLLVGPLIGLTLHISDSQGPETVIAGPASPRNLPVEFDADTATVEIGLLDGTRLRVTVPDESARVLANMTFADLEWHGALSAERGQPPPKAWRIDVARGSVDSLIPGG